MVRSTFRLMLHVLCESIRGIQATFRFPLFSVVHFRNILLAPYSLLPPVYPPSSLGKSLQTQRPALTGRR